MSDEGNPIAAFAARLAHAASVWESVLVACEGCGGRAVIFDDCGEPLEVPACRECGSTRREIGRLGPPAPLEVARARAVEHYGRE